MNQPIELRMETQFEYVTQCRTIDSMAADQVKEFTKRLLYQYYAREAVFRSVIKNEFDTQGFKQW